MSVSCTYSPSFGVKITVGLPRHIGREAGFEICDAIDALIRERLKESTITPVTDSAGSYVQHEQEAPVPAPAPIHPSPLPVDAGAEALAEWPSIGKVTVGQIVAYWNIGGSSFRNRVRDGVFSIAVDCPDRAVNAPKVWDAATIGRELAASGYVRRG